MAIIGDGALTAGMAFEALNNAGVSHRNLLVILHDNDMSISTTGGALSRYLAQLMPVLSDSAAWTEEIARDLLIATVFTGAAIGVAKNNHIQVDFFFRYFPRKFGHLLALAVDVLRIAFFGAAVVYTGLMMEKMSSLKMTIVDLPVNIVYGVCAFGFATMCLRSMLVMRVHLKRGYTVLQRPESTMEDR